MATTTLVKPRPPHPSKPRLKSGPSRFRILNLYTNFVIQLRIPAPYINCHGAVPSSFPCTAGLSLGSNGRSLSDRSGHSLHHLLFCAARESPFCQVHQNLQLLHNVSQPWLDTLLLFQSVCRSRIRSTELEASEYMICELNLNFSVGVNIRMGVANYKLLSLSGNFY